MDIQEFKNIFPNYKLPYYTHFDARISLAKALKYVQNPNNIKHHAFYPFIEFTTKHYKYSYNEQRQKLRQLKVRNLDYAAHIDSFIYKYYSFLLNAQYEQHLKKANIASCVLAYRSDLHKKCNIHFAKTAFNFLKNTPNAYVIVGDFKDFFGSLNHRYLKQSLATVLGTSSLTDDYYAIFKSLTKYATVQRQTLLKLNKLSDTAQGLKSFNQLSTALPHNLTISAAKKLIPNFIHKNPYDYGIPQGTSISGLFANIYLLEFDKALQQLVKQSNGLYLRYCDDIIIILPRLNKEEFQKQYTAFKSILASIPNLCLEEKKTNIFFYNHNKLKNICNEIHTTSKYCVDAINYLGFMFTNDGISIRDKVISKYYYRMYKKALNISKVNSYCKKHYGCKNLYLRYSTHHEKIIMAHARIKYTANFLDYVKHATAIFKDEKMVATVLKKHLHKIRQKLNS